MSDGVEQGAEEEQENERNQKRKEEAGRRVYPGNVGLLSEEVEDIISFFVFLCSPYLCSSSRAGTFECSIVRGLRGEKKETPQNATEALPRHTLSSPHCFFFFFFKVFSLISFLFSRLIESYLFYFTRDAISTIMRYTRWRVCLLTSENEEQFDMSFTTPYKYFSMGKEAQFERHHMETVYVRLTRESHILTQMTKEVKLEEKALFFPRQAQKFQGTTGTMIVVPSYPLEVKKSMCVTSTPNYGSTSPPRLTATTVPLWLLKIHF